MSDVQRICAFYTRGPHFPALLKQLRALYPGAHITALTPPGYPRSAVASLADEVRSTGQAVYSWRDRRALMALRNQIRAARYDLFAVMFDTPKQRFLAWMSGAPHQFCLTPDGRFIRIRLGLMRVAWTALYRQVRGQITYRYIRYVVNHRHVEPRQ